MILKLENSDIFKNFIMSLCLINTHLTQDPDPAYSVQTLNMFCPPLTQGNAYGVQTNSCIFCTQWLWLWVYIKGTDSHVLTTTDSGCYIRRTDSQHVLPTPDLGVTYGVQTQNMFCPTLTQGVAYGVQTHRNNFHTHWLWLWVLHTAYRLTACLVRYLHTWLSGLVIPCSRSCIRRTDSLLARLVSSM